MLESIAGDDNVGDDVVCVNIFDEPKVHSHDTIGFGPDEVDPSNVQSSVMPPLVSSQVSVSCGPRTPNDARGVGGTVTSSAALIDVPA
jgi:hypothetical protein